MEYSGTSFIVDKLVQEISSVIWRCPLLGGFIVIMLTSLKMP